MSKRLPFIALMATVFMTLALTACDDNNDYYYSPLVGDWVLVADDYGPVDMYQSSFELYADGTGIYTDYDEWGHEYTYNIFWEPDGSQLYISFADGSQWAYQWSVTGTMLYLTDLDTGSMLTFQMY